MIIKTYLKRQLSAIKKVDKFERSDMTKNRQLVNNALHD